MCKVFLGRDTLMEKLDKLTISGRSKLTTSRRSKLTTEDAATDGLIY